MSLNQNQLTESIVQGALDLNFSNNLVSVQIDSTESGTLLPGTPVKMVDSASGIPKVIAATVNTNDILGFITYTQKDKNFVAGDACEIALVNGGCCMYMTASAAISRGAQVAVVISGTKIVTATSALRIVGIAFDKAAADGDLIRVLMLPKGAVV